MSYSRTYSTLGSPYLNLDEAIALATRHGLAGVELRILGGAIDLSGYLRDTYGTPSALAARLRHEKVKITSLGTSFKLVGSTRGERAAFLGYVPWAEALGVRLRVFDGGRKADRTTVEEMADTFAWWRNLRNKNRWRTDLMVETHDTLLTSEAIGRLLQLAPGTGILWDTHHIWRKGGESPRQPWQVIRRQVVHLHVKDSVGIRGGEESFEYCLPGDGEFPMRSLLSAIRGDYAGPVSLEWERLWHPALPPVEDALAAATRNQWW